MEAKFIELYEAPSTLVVEINTEAAVLQASVSQYPTWDPEDI